MFYFIEMIITLVRTILFNELKQAHHAHDKRYTIQQISFHLLEPYGIDPTEIISVVGKIASPRWIPSIPGGTNYYNWRLTTDLTPEGRGYLFRFTVVKPKDEDPRLCQNDVTFIVESDIKAQFCLNQVPETTIFIPLYPSNELEIVLNTEDSQQYGFIGKYATGQYCVIKFQFCFHKNSREAIPQKYDHNV